MDVARDRRQRVVDEVRRDLGAQSSQLGTSEALGLLVHRLQLRTEKTRRLSDRACVVRGDAMATCVERDERAHEFAGDEQRRCDGRTERTVRFLAADLRLDVQTVLPGGSRDADELITGVVMIVADALKG